ncbi:MAG TPA: hypothetical protein DCR14_04485 [Acidimicrobiaceae bacterium]|nr:hypothetical protein [Acidimicrobiaceae bacterium]
MAWTEHPRIMPFRRKSATVNTGLKAVDNFRVHRTGRNSALVAHYGFMSVFPLMLVFTTILGFVLDDRPKLRERTINSVFARFPIIGQQLENEPEGLTGNAVALVIGLLLALWAGMRAFNMLQMALDDIAEVPLDDRRNLLHTRLRSLLGIAVVGGAQIGSAVLTTLVGFDEFAVVHKLLLAASAVALNALVLAATYRWLCSRPTSWRAAAPGAVTGGVLFAGLQLVGTAVVGRAIANASPVYGTFATVIGLITWLGLHAMVALMGAELNRVLPARKWSKP